MEEATKKGLTFPGNPDKLEGPEVSTLKETGALMGTSGCLVCPLRQGKILSALI